MKRVFATAVVWIGVITSAYYVLVVENSTAYFDKLFPVFVGGLIVNVLILTKKKRE